jgi:hypothetical protein
MKKFEENGCTATVTNNTVRWEYPIANLVNAFNYDPENPSYNGEDFVSVKRGKREEFAEYVAKNMIQPYDQETGQSPIEDALQKVFIEVFEGYENFAKYPEDDDE